MRGPGVTGESGTCVLSGAHVMSLPPTPLTWRGILSLVDLCHEFLLLHFSSGKVGFGNRPLPCGLSLHNKLKRLAPSSVSHPVIPVSSGCSGKLLYTTASLPRLPPTSLARRHDPNDDKLLLKNGQLNYLMLIYLKLSSSTV